MSFDWNLSSDEEDGFDDWANVDLKASLKPTTTTHVSKPQHDDTDDDSESGDEKEKGIATVAFFEGDEGNDGEEEEEDEIGWEDADEDDDAPHETAESADSKLAANTVRVPLKPVTVDWTKDFNQNKKKKASKKLKVRRSYRFEHLPPDMQVFLANLEKTHLLSLTSHAVHVSQFCSRDDVLHVAHSLIPEPWLTDNSSCTVPTITELRDFCNWFFNLVNHTEQRRRETQWANRRAGAPRRGKKRKGSNTNGATQLKDGSIRYHTLEYCSYLSRTHDDNPQLLGEDSQYTSWTNPDKVQLLVSMARYVLNFMEAKASLLQTHSLFF
jgi:hypothetical protein